ncbi:MAG: PDZ domain-containing protein, partial [Anaerolineales bacterium]|nr:PDZ domain-containing protein [Anaerolineales bacterium]
LGADIYLYTIETDETALVDVSLTSDMDHMRSRWVKNPVDYLSAWQLSPKGDQVVMVSRGRVFVAPVEDGRFVEVTRESGVRYRAVRFFPNGEHLLALSDASGELEYVKLPANGMGEPEQITDNGQVFRYRPVISPDGKSFAFADKDQRLWLVNVETRASRLLAASQMSAFYHMSWSPDSRWLAFVELAENTHSQIKLCEVESGEIMAVTSDRVDSYSPAWSPDGKWLYFLSDRHFNSIVPGPWGPRQPDPYFDKTTKLYMFALQKETRSPFQPDDELVPAAPSNNNKKNNSKKENGDKKDEPIAVEIDFDRIMTRIYEIPVAPGRYVGLKANKKALFWLDRTPGQDGTFKLLGLEIKNKKIETQTLTHNTNGYSLSANGEKLLVRQNNSFFTFDATGKTPKADEKKRLKLSQWMFEVDSRQEWRQMFVDAWRLERDYFYDRNLHGIDWQGLFERHLPLVERVTDRDELDNLLAQLVGELAALHTFVRDGDKRRGKDRIAPASLGAAWSRDEAAGGYRIDHIYETEPDYPERYAPLARPEVNVQAGDVIESINGVSTLAVPHPALLLRNQAGKQVRLRVKTAVSAALNASVSDTPVDKIAVPISIAREADLRYDEWEYHNRLYVDEKGAGQLGYIHMRAMRGDNYTEWAQAY